MRYNCNNIIATKRGDGIVSALKELVEKLPPDLQQKVKDFVEFLLKRTTEKQKRKLRLDWAGALRDYR